MPRLKHGRVLVVLGVVALLALPGLRRSHAADGDDGELPNVRRLQIPPERLAAELERVKQGVLVQMPRSEFDARWERASKAVAAQQNPPRLVEARYSAVLADTSMVRGTGQWRVLNPGAAGILGLQPLNLALQNARLQQPAGNGEAILGDLDGKSLGLLVEQTGEHTAFFDWSLRGIPAPDGIRFDVRVPACAVATLELRLPADRAIAAREGFLLSGPHPAETPDLRRWQIDFAGQSQVDLMIRRATRSDPTPPLVLAQVVSRQEVEPDVVRADYDFDLESPHHGVQEFQFECDPGLHPYEVTVRNAAGALESWTVRSETPGRPTVFVARLREPFQDSTLPLKVQVRCWASIADRLWSCPEVRVVGALIRGERLALRVHPDVRLDDWQAGTFVFASEAEAPGPKSRLGDGWQTYTLVNQGSLPNGPRGRPRARVILPRPHYQARQLAWWQIGTRGSSLTSWITYEVEHGPVFRLPLTLPPGWSVSRVETDPIDLLRNWTVFREEGRNTLNVDLSRPLAPNGGKPTAIARLRVEMLPEGTWVMPAGGRTLPVPDLAPRGASTREGGLAVSFGPLLEGRVQVSAPSAPPEEKGPWGRQTPDSYHAYRGMPVVGSVVIRPHRTQFRARVTSEVVLNAEGAVVESRVHLQPGVGSPAAIDMHVAAGGADAWEWRVVRGGTSLKSVHRQPALEAAAFWRALGALNPLDGLVRATAPVPQAQVWRLTFAQPLREPVRLLGRCKIAATAPEPDQRSWFAALPVVLGADAMDGEVTVHARDVAITAAVPGAGMTEEPGAQPRSPATWRTFRYQSVPAALRLTGQRRPTDKEAGVLHPMIPRASLIASADPAGRLRIHYAFLLEHWPQRLIPLRLPAEALVLGARAEGRWVGDVDITATLETGLVVNVPVPAGPGPHPLELIYDLPIPAWKTWASLEAVTPEPPIEPLALRRIWRLPAGTVPLRPDRFTRLPGSGGDARWLAAALPPPNLQPRAPLAQEIAALAPALETFVPRSAQDWKDEQRVQMEDIASALAAEARRRPRWTLGESVDYALRGTQPYPLMFVIDAAAFRGERLYPETPLVLPDGPRAPGVTSFSAWDRIGVVPVTAEAVPLLSTLRQQQAWDAAGTLPADIEQAVREAAQHGHDRSGRFRSAAEWLSSGAAHPGALPPLASPGLADVGEGWADWEPIATSEPVAVIVVVRENVLSGAGMTGALVLAALAFRGQRWPRRRRGFLLFGWLTLAGLALWSLPGGLRTLAWYPALCGAAVAIIAYLRSVSRRQRMTQAGAGAAVAIAALSLFPGYAQAPAGFTVLLVPGDDEATQTVLVPPNLVQLLDTISVKGVGGLRTPVLLGAQYEGTVNAAGTAEFRAEYRLCCFTDEPAAVALPLGNLGSNDPLQLKEALLDGAKAYPDAAPPPREGYLLKDIKGKGIHVVVLRFSVPAGMGEERGVRLSVPEVVQSRLTMETPAGSRHLYAATGRGRQSVSPELPATAPADKPLKLEVDLGRASVLHVRWREEGREPRAARLTAKEAYLWKLQPLGSSLSAIYQFTVKQGAATSIDLDVPETLAVRGISVGRLPTHSTTEALPRLRDWTLGNGKLHLQFHRPIARGVQVSLELVPRQLPGPNGPLPLPAPRDVRGADGFLAFQTEGLEAQVAEHLRVNGLAARAFTRVWDEAGMPDPGPEIHAYSFQRTAGGPPVVRLNLTAPGTGVDCRQRVAWHVVHAGQADLAVLARFRAVGRPISLVEWDVPEAVKDIDVLGPDVRAWSRTGSRVQVWLNRPCPHTELRLTGWQGLEPAKGGRLPPAATSRLRFGSINVAGTAPTTTYVYLSAADGIVLHPESFRQLALLPTLRRSDRELALLAAHADYGGDVVTIERPAQAEAHLLTFGELRERDFAFTATLDIQPPVGDSRTVTLRVLRAGDTPLHLDAPAAVGRLELPRTRDRQGWTLTVPPGGTASYRVRVTGLLPFKLGTGVMMPDVRVDGLARVERNVAFAGRELRADDAAGLAVLTDVSDRLKRWPGELDRIRRTGTAWQVRADDWRLRLVPRAPTQALNASQIVLADHSAAVVDGRRWLHRATFWIYHESDSDLRVDLPTGAVLKSLSVDETEMVPASPANPVWVPRSRLNGARALRLAWVFDAEPLEHPNLTPPRLAEVADGPAQWTVHVAPGFEMTGGSPSAAVDLDVERTRALLRLSERIVEHDRTNPSASGALAGVQELFYRCARKAELGDAGDAIAELYEQNKRLADAHGFDAIRRQAERQAGTTPSPWTTTDTPRSESGPAPDAFPPAERGTPAYWLFGRAVEPQDVPDVTLAATRTRSAMWGTRLLAVYLCLLAGAVLLSLSSRLAQTARAFWSEQMLLLGIAGWALLGGTWIFAFLVLLGILGRLVHLAGWLGSLRPKPLPPGPGSTVIKATHLG